jgi:hypothetical protein
LVFLLRAQVAFPPVPELGRSSLAEPPGTGPARGEVRAGGVPTSSSGSTGTLRGGSSRPRSSRSRSRSARPRPRCREGRHVSVRRSPPRFSSGRWLFFSSLESARSTASARAAASVAKADPVQPSARRIRTFNPPVDSSWLGAIRVSLEPSNLVTRTRTHVSPQTASQEVVPT